MRNIGVGFDVTIYDCTLTGPPPLYLHLADGQWGLRVSRTLEAITVGAFSTWQV